MGQIEACFILISAIVDHAWCEELTSLQVTTETVCLVKIENGFYIRIISFNIQPKKHHRTVQCSSNGFQSVTTFSPL